MPFFYYDGIIDPKQPIELKGSETRHIRMTRKIRPGEEVELQDDAKKRYVCKVVSVRNSFVSFQAISEVSAPPEPSHQLHLAVGLPKEKALDLILQKSVELGVHTLYFFETEFSQRLPKGSAKEGKYERWSKILREACKQCGRLTPPQLEIEADVFQLSRNFSSEGENDIWVAHPAEDNNLKARLAVQSPRTLLLIGPEGGFSKADLDVLPSNYLGLGARILRCETAAFACATLVQFFRGDMRGGKV